MSLASARGTGAVGQALIGIGEGIMQVGDKDAQNRAEEIKLTALNSVKRDESAMQMYRWGSESDTQKEQFGLTHAENVEARKAQDRATQAQIDETAESRKLRERLGLADIEIRKDQLGLDYKLIDINVIHKVYLSLPIQRLKHTN